MTRLAFAYPAFLLAGGIALIQYHAIAFWSDAVDPVTGWAWSILLELVALWLWYRPRTRPLAFITTCLVLSGPLYQVSAPLVRAMAENAAQSTAEPQRAALLRDAIAQDQKTLQTFLMNSRSRAGWLPAIKRTRADLRDKRGELRELLIWTPEAMPWQRTAVIFLQAVGLLVIQISNVLTITALSERKRETKAGKAPRTEDRKTARRQRPRQRDPIPAPAASRIQTALRRHLAATGESARAFAAEHGFSARDLSLVLHDDENHAAGKRRAPRQVFDRLSALLLEKAA